MICVERRSQGRIRALLVSGVLAAVAIASSGAASTASAAPAWDSEVFQAPTNLPPGGKGHIRIMLANAGDAAATAWPTVSFSLPPGVTIGAPAPNNFWSCGGSPVTTCTNPLGTAIFGNPGPASYVGSALVADLKLTVDVGMGATPGTLPFEVTMSDGGAPTATETHQLNIGLDQIPFGPAPDTFEAGAFDQGAADDTRAGGHPYQATASFRYATRFAEPSPSQPASFQRAIQSEGIPRDVVADLPPGFIGDPTAGPKCPDLGRVSARTCPAVTQVGVATISPPVGTAGRFRMYGIYNVVPPRNAPAQLAFQSPVGVVALVPTLRSDRDYGLSATVRNITSADTLFASSVTLWGVPADPAHDAERCAAPNYIARACTGLDEGGLTPVDTVPPDTFSPHASNSALKPFLTNPTECSGQPVQTTIHLSQYEVLAPFNQYGDPDLGSPGWRSASSTAPPLTGCDKLQFNPSLVLRPTATEANSPTGLHVELSVPQNDNYKALAAAHLRDTTVLLPEGMTVNPSSADGLGSCAPGQIGLTSPIGNDDPAFDKGEPRCPPSSKIGSVEVDTPLLDDPLSGDVYLARQFDNPFGSLLGIYIVVEGPGLIVKLAGHVEADPGTGRLSTSVLDNPQLPFETFTLDFKAGPRAPLITPGCGAHTTEATLTSWAAPNVEVGARDSFQITRGPNGGPCPTGALDPKLSAGVLSPIAGDSSPFVLSLKREDGSGVFTALDVTTPEGLTAKLKGVPYCPEATIGSFPASALPGAGAAELGAPACPAASRVGSVTVGAGAGSSPFYPQGAEGASGRLYLAGPYKGAPLSLVAMVPALAGPFDLGVVVNRIALGIDPRTAQITASSDPIPTILSGIPLGVREIRVNVDRSGFMQSPTDCSPASVDATVHGAGGATARVSDYFQVGACRALGFKPGLALKLFGGTRRGEYPRLRATLTAREGDANIARTAVTLPHSAFLAQEHIRTICTRVQFAADQCPAGSVYGKATAVTPLLDQPLSGPVYLRSSDNPLPDLVAVLRGPDAQPIEIELVGAIDSHNKGIRNTFAVVPDAPVSKFTLEMKGGAKGLIVNSRDICKTKNRATVRLGAQNGRVHDFRPLVTSPGCGRARKG